MTNKKLNTFFTFRVTIAVLIAAAIIFLPVAVLAETVDTTNGGSSTPEEIEAGGFEADGDSFNAAPGTTTDLFITESGAGDTTSFPEAPALVTDSNPVNPSTDQQSDLQEPIASDPTDTSIESIEAGGSALGVSTDNTGSSVDQQGDSPAASSDAGSGVTTETSAFNQTQYFQVAGNSMNPLLQPGSMVEIVSETYADGDMVVAQTADGTYIIKTVSGDCLVSEGTGLSFALTDVTILGAATYSSMTTDELALAGCSWTSVLALGLGVEPTLVGGFYQIATWENLYWISEDSLRWGNGYIQTAAITFPGDHVAETGGIYNWDDDKGWTPIGYFGKPFTGSYNGQGYTISNLFINRPTTDDQGLFGYTHGADLTNIALVKVNITGVGYVGGLVGINGGTVTNSYTTGTVTGSDNRVGGLVGNNSGTITNGYAIGAVTGGNHVGGLVGWNDGTITNCYATGVVTGSGSEIGGLSGTNNNDGTITNSYATGAVTGLNEIGGLVGWNDGAITDSYATGVVTGSGDRVGGLVGMNHDGTIANSYATGAVTGSGNHVGGLVGIRISLNANITNCFWSIDNRPVGFKGIGSGSGDAIGTTTADMQTLAFHENTLGWSISGLASGYYPILGWQVAGKGTTWNGTSIWYLGPLPTENGGNSGGLNFGFSFTEPFTQIITAPGSGRPLTNISGLGSNALITPAFVTGGSAADLGMAIAAYNQAKQNYAANQGTMDAADKAVAEVELAVANAAILALDLSLAAQSGQSGDLTALIAAYQAALAVLNSNRGLLTAEQIDAAEELLNAIATVISRFST